MNRILKGMIILPIFIGSFCVACQNETSRKVQNLETFARLYGYARWFHPSDEAQEIDWDKFAILGVQKVENVKSSKELRDTLYRLFSPIVQGLQLYEAKKPEIFDREVLSSPDPDAKPVAWQHHGVFLNERSNSYKSIRTNKRKVDKKVEGTTITKNIYNPSHLVGKEVKFSGYFMSNKEGAKLFVQPMISSTNDKKHEALISEAQEWERVELSLKVPDETIGIIYGLEIEGDADVLADDFEFVVNDGEKWIPADTTNMGFERGKTKDIEIPVDEWTTSATLHTFEISDECSHLGKYGLKVNYTGKMFDRMPEFGEITKSSIGNDLICVVPLTLLSNDSSTYPKTEKAIISRLQDELNDISVSSNFNIPANLASVIITWNVLQHFFPYFDVIDVNWDNVLGETLKSTIHNKVKKDFFVTLNKMIAKINDGHGLVLWESMYHLPFRAELIENKIVVTTSNDFAVKRGDVIKTLDNKKIMNVLHEKEKLISGSPQLRRFKALYVLGSEFDKDESDLVFERDGITYIVSCLYENNEQNMFFNPNEERKNLAKSLVEIEPGIFYIKMSHCTAKEFEQKKDVLAKAKAVIYDQRGGSRLNFFQIVPYLIKEPVSSTWWNTPQTVYPDRKEVEFSNSNWDVQPKQPFFNSKTIIINDPSVVSSGETMMGIIDHYHLAITVGEPTAGCNGNVNSINLPCGYNVMWTGMKVLKHDGSQLYLKGFEPDYPVKKTIQAIKEGRDEYLEKAIEIIRQE